jgi:hypothetical protein
MSMQVFSARVQNGTIVLDEGIDLPEGLSGSGHCPGDG